MNQNQINEHVRRAGDKLLAKKDIKPSDKAMSKKKQRRLQREALCTQVQKYCDEGGYIRTPIPNDLFVQCLNWNLLRKEKRDTPCPRGFPEWWFVKLED